MTYSPEMALARAWEKIALAVLEIEEIGHIHPELIESAPWPLGDQSADEFAYECWDINAHYRNLEELARPSPLKRATPRRMMPHEALAALQHEAEQTPAGKALRAANFTLCWMGGNCTAWGRNLSTGTVLITSSDGTNHLVDDDAAGDEWVVALNDKGGTEHFVAHCGRNVAVALAYADSLERKTPVVLPF